MLTQWRLSKFKSVTAATDLKIAPLTVFTGANSAGKSTVIQSMLLTVQTVQSPVIGRPVVLNGHIARLGSFTDLVSGGDENGCISLGFDLEFDKAPGVNLSNSQRSWRQYLFHRRGSQLERVSVDYAFCAVPGPNDFEEIDLLRLQPSLLESSISVVFREDDRVGKDGVNVQRARESIAERARSLRLTDVDIDSSDIESLRYVVTKSPKKFYSGRLNGVKVKTDVVGAHLHHFLPRVITSRFDELSAEVNWKLSLLLEPNAYRAHSNDSWQSTIPSEAVTFIVSVIKNAMKMNEEAVGSHGFSGLGSRLLEEYLGRFTSSCELDDMLRLYKKLPGRDVSLIFSVLGNEKAQIEKLFRAGRTARTALDAIYPTEHVASAIDYVHSYFLRGVKYLGPLRDEPKPVYPLVGSSDPADVGFKGEHTAAVLHVHKNTQISYVPSSDFAEGADKVGIVQAHLASAVQDWLCYMGVGRDFVTSDLGKLGHELKVMTEGSTLKHDLTQVGVGVSQVLPILVLALLADEGTTLVFEQPELHLHPRVQSRLADFFVSMAQLGKQCIVETHSEYFINRLRFRSAADPGDFVSKSTVIYFVTKEGVRSNYRQISLDDFGGFDSWPDGFFDESEEATARLLRRSLQKRRERAGVKK